MAKFHMTPEGPKKCSAQSHETCRYTHYSTPEGAVAAHEIETEKKSAVNTKRDLEYRLENLNDNEAVQPLHDMQDRGDLGPTLMARVNAIEERTGQRPEFIPGIAEAVFKGPGSELHFAARKGYTVEGSPPRVVPNWTLSTHQTLNGRVINKTEESYPLTNEAEGRELKKAALAKLTESTEKAWPGDPAMAQQKRDAAVDSFVNVVNSCETAERGILEADRVGFSNFRGSTDEKVVVKADWAESVIEPQNMIDAMNSDRYRGKQPEVNVLIQDSMCKSSPNYWTAERSNEGWKVHLTRDGQTEVKPVEDMDELKSTIYNFSKTEMGSSEERASRSAENTTDFFGVTEFQVQQQEERAEAHREEERREREAELHDDLYGEKPKLKQSGIGKLFSIFG